MKRCIVAICAVGIGCAAVADLYVDEKSTAFAPDGSQEAPFRTIQDAVDAASAGMTIRVLPGTYSTGGDVDSNGLTNRVRIQNKQIRIESTKGAAVTHIVGVHSADGRVGGLGTDAVRCICIEGTSSSGTVVKGFTLCNGGTMAGNGNQTMGGAFCAYTGVNYAKNMFLVDCVVSNNCGARGGAMANATAIRCIFVDNWVTNDLAVTQTRGGQATRNSCHYNCLFTRNGHEFANGGRAVCDYPLVTVNCTFSDNRCTATRPINEGAIAYTGPFINCAMVANYTSASDIPAAHNASGATYSDKALATNCVIADASGKLSAASSGVKYAASRKQFLAPAAMDYRPLAGSDLDGTGSLGAEGDMISFIPAEFRGKDLYGNDRVVNGSIDVGCVQGAASVAGGGIVLDTDIIGVSGAAPSPIPGAYVCVTSWPACVYLMAQLPSGKTLFSYQATATTNEVSGAQTDGEYHRFPDRDGGLWALVPSASRGSVHFTHRYANQVGWVDDAAGSDVTGTGTASKPWKTMQKADSALGGFSVVNVRPGRYATGASTNYLWSGQYTSNRVSVTKNFFFRSTGGASNTFIVGAADTTADADSYGNGPSAIRCICAVKNKWIGFSGFTLTDGHTGKDVSDTKLNWAGGGLLAENASSSANVYCQLLDCVITNCWGSRGAAVNGGFHQRCIITDCHQVPPSGNGVMRQAVSSSCVFTPDNDACAQGPIGGSSSSYHCTVVSTSGMGQVTFANQSNYNSIFIGGSTAEAPNTSSGYSCLGNFMWNVTTVPGSGMGGYAFADPRLAHPRSGDVRLRPDSPVIGGGTSSADDIANYNRYWCSDINNNPLLIANGRVTVGAVQTIGYIPLGCVISFR